MCRIHGQFNTPTRPGELSAVSAAQHHGGPDAQTWATGPGWALGSNRLAVMDPHGGDQPYRLGDHITVVFNGEIYNHTELRARLRARGHHIPGHCDGSLLPALYAEYGTAFTDHLDGMYAIAVVDTRREPTLVLAVDDMGMKPLYYQHDAHHQRISFASELPALLAFDAVTARAWEAGLEEYLATKTPFGEQTMFDHIRVLPPASTLIATPTRGPRLIRRTTPAQPGLPPGPEAGPEAAEGLLARLRRQVHRLLHADVPVAAVVSGGLDSSLVAALAAEAHPALHTFTIGYKGEGWPGEERHFARQVADRIGAHHHEVELDPATLPDLLPDVVRHLGQPNADPITLPSLALFRAIRGAGFTVALTGDAADELLAGYDRVRHALTIPPGRPWSTGYTDALAAVPQVLREELYTADYRAFVKDRGPAGERLAGLLAAQEESQTPPPHQAAGGDRRLDILTRFETGTRMPAYDLRRVDHMSMAAAVEVRLPYCQPAVQHYARALPAALKVTPRRGKDVLYTAAARHLPPAVLGRPKQPFTLPVTAMLRPGTPLFSHARDVLSTARLRRAGQLDAARVQRLFTEQAETPSNRAALAIWALLVHQLWLDHFPPAPAAALPAGPGGGAGREAHR
ncbi:asparagine synthase (glutamine-hydrolyzing) [Streptomyces sp. NPDC048106]|uniref:asparagine synthase (glutamine-hydrolyzing) n=1 Tax=Streptomyces sp. NPDC048106 TaxID=3155750 RepID=UPI003456CF1F